LRLVVQKYTILLGKASIILQIKKFFHSTKRWVEGAANANIQQLLHPMNFQPEVEILIESVFV